MEQRGPCEIEELKRLYKETDIPSDRLIKDRTALDAFAAALNGRTRRNIAFSAEEVADQLLRLRKAGKLPRIRR